MGFFGLNDLDFEKCIKENQEKIKKYYWKNNKKLIEKRLGYIFFRMDEDVTFSKKIDTGLLYEKNYIYETEKYEEVKAKEYCDFLWNKKYPDWNGESLEDIKNKNFEDYEKPSVNEILSTIIVVDISDFIKTWLYKEE